MRERGTGHEGKGRELEGEGKKWYRKGDEERKGRNRKAKETSGREMEENDNGHRNSM